MKRRLVILTEIIAPYRIPLFNALARSGDVDLHVVFLAETDPHLRQWRVYKEEIRFSHEVLPSWRKRWGKHSTLVNRGVARTLAAAAPDVVLCGGYNHLAFWSALFWARSHGTPFLLWSESNLQDQRRGYALIEFFKRQFLRRCSGFVVPGRSALEYLLNHNVDEGRIFTAPNAIDNPLFGRGAATARENAIARRRELDLPERYFLFVGRLVREKGVFDLLAAYAKLSDSMRRRSGLVFVGDGESRGALEEQAASIAGGMIRFAGFVQREQLATYYGLAQVLILPTYTDTWGLVVNEAMACGLPVILSRAAGCAADLVKETWNGWLISPRDVEALGQAMTKIGEQPELSLTMGANSREHIGKYSAVEWSLAVARAVELQGGRGE